MAVNIVFTGSSFCAASGHFSVDITGGVTTSMRFSAPQIVGNALSADEKELLVLLLLRYGQQGKTPAQAKSWLVGGITVTIT